MRAEYIILFTIAALGCRGASPQTSAVAPHCDSVSRVGTLPPELTEASGVAISQRNPGILWVHNDDAPVTIFGIDSTGAIRARIRVPAIKTADLEDIAVARCGDSSCLYLGDIGDNKQDRTDRSVYRLIEPLATDTAAVPNARFRFHLPGRSQDAEALFVMPGERMYIVTKGRSGPVAVYQFPSLDPKHDVELEPLYQLTPGMVQLPDLVTGAGVTPDGKTIVIRTYSAFQLYAFRGDTLKSLLPQSFDLQPLSEPQGEGVDIRADGTLFLVGERGFSDSAPPIGRVQCHITR